METSLREGAGVLLTPRRTTDSRLPLDEQQEFTPTPKQMLYGQRAKIVGVPVERDAAGRAVAAWAEIEISGARRAAKDTPPGFVFGTFDDRNAPLIADELYALDPDPNDWFGGFLASVVTGLCEGKQHELYQRFCDSHAASTRWPDQAHAAQQKFLDGLDALGQTNKDYVFEPSKRDYISKHGDAPLLLVQGPPGTGKSYATAFALWARMQGAMATGLDWRVFSGCKSHAATDVLLANIRDVQNRLRDAQRDHPALFQKYFDPRLLEVPLFRAAKTEAMDGVIPLPRSSELEKGAMPAARRIGELFGHALCGCVVFDEASQMNLPEAVMASLALCPEGQVIVVGHPRQMPPIIKHNWQAAPRRAVLLRNGNRMLRFLKRCWS